MKWFVAYVRSQACIKYQNMISRKQKIQTSLKNMAETFDIHGNFSLLLDHLSENWIIIKKADKQSK